MADGVIVHVPASNLLVEADLTTQDWDFNWWGDSLMNNIEYRKIKVDTNLAVHAQKPFPLAEVVGHRETGSQHAGVLPPCRRGAVLPARLPDSATTDRCRRNRRDGINHAHHEILCALSAAVVIAALS